MGSIAFCKDASVAKSASVEKRSGVRYPRVPWWPDERPSVLVEGINGVSMKARETRGLATKNRINEVYHPPMIDLNFSALQAHTKLAVSGYNGTIVPFLAAGFSRPFHRFSQDSFKGSRMTAVRSLAARVATLQPSATAEMSERVRNARAAGKRILGLSSGDPNIPTDPRIIAAAERSLRRGDTLYSAPAGLAPLREALASRATFYLFPKVAADERVVAKRWLDEGGIAVLPGSAFGDGGKIFLRISLACSDADLDEALIRIERLGIGA